jgi:hypothetical protein
VTHLIQSEDAKDIFLNSCKTAATRILYQKGLNYFMDFIQLGRNELDGLLERDPKLIQMDIIRFITHMKNKNNGSSTISAYVSGLNKFLTMNDVISLNWKRSKVSYPKMLRLQKIGHILMRRLRNLLILEHLEIKHSY